MSVSQIMVSLGGLYVCLCMCVRVILLRRVFKLCIRGASVGGVVVCLREADIVLNLQYWAVIYQLSE